MHCEYDDNCTKIQNIKDNNVNECKSKFNCCTFSVSKFLSKGMNECVYARVCVYMCVCVYVCVSVFITQTTAILKIT